jgi:hypothetical protein
MKKLMLAACLTIVAVVVAPVATANAGELIGACTITGEATITPKLPKLPGETPKLYSYTFKSKEIAVLGELTQCTGSYKETIAEAPGTLAELAPASAEVTGEALVSCPVSVGGVPVPVIESVAGAPGSGYIEAAGHKAEFKKAFTFVGTGTDVHFAIAEPPLGSAAAGEATFATDIGAVLKCAGVESGEVKSLEFTAVASGKVG